MNGKNFDSAGQDEVFRGEYNHLARNARTEMKSEILNRSIKAEVLHQASQYLSFSLGTDYYGVDILRVHEIRGWEPVREIPGTPKYT